MVRGAGTWGSGTGCDRDHRDSRIGAVGRSVAENQYGRILTSYMKRRSHYAAKITFTMSYNFHNRFAKRPEEVVFWPGKLMNETKADWGYTAKSYFQRMTECLLCRRSGETEPPKRNRFSVRKKPCVP